MPVPNMMELRIWGGELYDAISVVDGEVGIEAEVQSLVEVLRAVHIRDREDDDFELEFHDLDS